MPIVYDKKLKIARAIAIRHDPTQEELKLARKMAQDGCSFEEIKIALQFSGHSNFNADKNGIDMKTYKPKNKS